MNDFEQIDETLDRVSDGTLIYRRSISYLSFILVIVGVVLAVWSVKAPYFAEHANLSATVMLGGGIFAFMGLIKFGISLGSKYPVYAPSGERIYRYEFYFQSTDKPALCTAVNSGNMQKVVSIPRNATSSSILLTLYATRSGSFSAGQVSQYVPHAFEPVTLPIRFTTDESRLAVALLS
ncbi:MAG: hypothetical protein PHV49_05580 [Alistipes sp.]|nr:hypothetical protein [Alistipes sp.]